jgi:hypothetical protein
MQQFPRDFYLPAQCKGRPADIRVIPLGVEVFFYEVAAKVYAIGFRGKALKPAFHERYSTAEHRAQVVQEWIGRLQKYADEKVAAREAKKAWQHGLKVGDIFVCSWGYDQTNIDYFEVVGLHGKSVDVLEIGCQSVEVAWAQGKSVPAPGQYVEVADYSPAGKAHYAVHGYYPKKVPAPRRMVPQRGYDGKPRLAIHSFASAYKMEPLATSVPGLKVYREHHWTAYA